MKKVYTYQDDDKIVMKLKKLYIKLIWLKYVIENV